MNFFSKDLGKPKFGVGDFIVRKDTKFYYQVTFIGERLDNPNHYRVHAKRVIWRPKKKMWKEVTGNIEILWRNYKVHSSIHAFFQTPSK